MKNLLLGIGLGLLLVGPSSFAVSICQSSACGRIVCPRGCVQQSHNGRCIVNRCTGWSKEASAEEVALDESISEEAAFGYCVSCNGGRCYRGRTFREAEARCKAHTGGFGCFTRCN